MRYERVFASHVLPSERCNRMTGFVVSMFKKNFSQFSKKRFLFKGISKRTFFLRNKNGRKYSCQALTTFLRGLRFDKMILLSQK